MLLEMSKKKVRKTEAELEKAIADGFGTWEIDVRELAPEVLQLLIVDKGTYYVIALRLIKGDHTKDDLTKEIRAALKKTISAPRIFSMKDTVYADTICACAKEAHVPYEIVKKFTTIPSIVRDVNRWLPSVMVPMNAEESIPSPFLHITSMAPHTPEPFVIPKFVPHRSYESVFRFKVSLMHVTPTIWRRLEVPATYTFFEFAVAILNAMGWAGSHLHGFHIAQKGTARTINIQIPHPENFGPFPEDDRDELRECIADYFGSQIKQCVFCYDFGDSWDHTVLFESELPKEKGIVYPRCIDGKNACPPDDCGGIGGYEDLQRILKNPRNPEHKNMLEWLCIDRAEDFDPTAFVPEEVDFESPKEYYNDLKRWGFFD
jgi:hypothetical protein